MSETLLIARTAGEMQQAQGRLIEWADAKLVELRAELGDADTEFKNARKRKWRSSGLSRIMTRLRGQVRFYDKVREALKAGFALVPDFPVSVFAIRTEYESPSGTTSNISQKPSRMDLPQRTESPALGDGKYVSPFPAVFHSSKQIPKDAHHDERTKFTIEATAFAEVDIPLALAKPVLADALDHAMALKCFDELGICPPTRRRARDPMVIGTVILKEGFREQRISFLVAWFLDTRTL